MLIFELSNIYNHKQNKHIMTLNEYFNNYFCDDLPLHEVLTKFDYLTVKVRNGGYVSKKRITNAYNNRTLAELIEKYDPIFFNVARAEYEYEYEAEYEAKYYAIFDRQTGDYKESGYNSTSKEDLADSIRDFIADGMEDSDKKLFLKMDTEGLLNHLESMDFVVEEQNTPFEDFDF